MSKDKISMPSSSAGITRYFDEYKSKLQFKPGHIIIIIIAVIILEILLHTFGRGLLS
ncbi:MAG: preprotein translocase subunit Sec61beta [Nanoarchaeota archaeon]|nr:preprotein translocase subunit Sec61beta [Nanoarchaeota archaeon]